MVSVPSYFSKLLVQMLPILNDDICTDIKLIYASIEAEALQVGGKRLLRVSVELHSCEVLF